jgi:hypothetical protein
MLRSSARACRLLRCRRKHLLAQPQLLQAVLLLLQRLC